MRTMICGCVLALALLSSGCATLTKGTSQTVTVSTDPTGATCTLSRSAKTVAVVNPTPGSVPIDKSKDPISVDCRKTGYLDAAGTLSSEFQPITFGNILFGGVVGIVIDAASGAMNQYPDEVTITLIPEVFATSVERDAFFEKMRETLLRESTEVRERIGKTCRSDQCERELAAAQVGTNEKLAEIEKRRVDAKLAE